MTQDRLDDLLADARPSVPAGLAARMLMASRSREAQARIFWADVERTARRALTVAAAAACLTVALAVATIVTRPSSDGARTASTSLLDTTDERGALGAIEQQNLEQYLESP